MTVSRVLNGHRWVAAATEARVRAAISTTGFRLNTSARNLRQGNSFAAVALVVDDITNPFYSAICRAAEDVAQAHDALLVVSSCGWEFDQERAVVETLVARGVEGLLLKPTPGDHSYLERGAGDGQPVVFFGRRPGEITGDIVVVDNVGGAQNAVEHLIGGGHTRIGALSPDQPWTAAAGYQAPGGGGGRLEGYRRALEAAGLAYDPELVRFSCMIPSAAAAATRELLRLPDPPTAFLAMDNRITVGALRALGSGLGGLALVGVDDFELADILDPPITVVTHDPYEMGRQAAKLLFARLAGEEIEPAQQVTLPMRLIVRGSGERPPTRSR